MKRSCVKQFLALGAIFLLASGSATNRGAGSGAARTAASERRASDGAAGPESLVVLHTNDVHSQLDPFGNGTGGAAARALRIERERARGGRVLLLDAGDLVQGTPYYNAFRGELEHRLLDAMGYDAAALGNHDLDDGPAVWSARARATRAPIVSANVFAAAESAWAGSDAPPADATRKARWVGGGTAAAGTPLRYLARPYVVVQRGGLRVAIFGLTTAKLERIVIASKNRGVAVGDPVDAARLLVPRLRREADVVIALTHLGVEDDRRLARRVPGIDLIVGGHSHDALRAPVLQPSVDGRSVPIVQAGSRGLYLGRTTLRWQGDGPRTAAGRLIAIRPADGEDPETARLVASYRERLSRDVDRVVFHAPEPIGRSDLDEGDSRLGNFVADVIRDATGAEIAVMNSGGIRAGIEAGDVTVGDVMRVLPFDNRLVVLSMKGVHVRALLDRAARSYGKGSFVHVSGVRYVARSGRATEITVAGAPLDGNRTYRVATIDFLEQGGDGYTIFAKATARDATDLVLWRAAGEYLESHRDFRFPKDGRVRWRGSTEALRDLGVR